jgi:uncharacterized protein involved in exopolysaccharide biosynthesis
MNSENIEGKQEEIEINLFDVINILWKKKFQIVFSVFIFSLFSIFYSLGIPNEYRSETKLSFTQSSGESLSSGVLGGLASMTGYDLGSTSKVDEAAVAIEIMTSWNFIDNFITENNLEVDLFASNGWDKATNLIQINPAMFSTEQGEWIITKPSSWERYDTFLSKLRVAPDYKTGFVSVSFDHYSPIFASSLLDKYIESINRFMTQRKLQQTEENLKYLNIQVKETTNIEMRNIFFSLIQEQVKEKMLALATPYYSLNYIYEPMPPERKFKPQRSIMVILGALLGLILSSVIVLILDYRKKS